MNGYVASLSAGFTLNAVQKAFGSCWFGPEKPELLVGPQSVWDQFWAKLQPQQRFNEESSDVAKAGFSSLRYNGAVVAVDQYAPSGTLWGLNMKKENFQLYVSALEKYQFGFSGFKEACSTLGLVKSSLIDLDAVKLTRAKGSKIHAERLTEKTPQGEVIVRAFGNQNRKSMAEMTVPLPLAA